MKEMRLRKRQVSDPDQLLEILESCRVVRLGMTDEEGMFIVPVNYGYDTFSDGGRLRLVLYIHGAREGRKAAVFAGNPSVAIEMDDMRGILDGDYTCSYSCAYRSIMGNGTLRELTDGRKKIHALTRIMEHMAPGSRIDFRPEMLERTGVYRIDVTSFTGKERT